MLLFDTARGVKCSEELFAGGDAGTEPPSGFVATPYTNETPFPALPSTLISENKIGVGHDLPILCDGGIESIRKTGANWLSVVTRHWPKRDLPKGRPPQRSCNPYVHARPVIKQRPHLGRSSSHFLWCSLHSKQPALDRGAFLFFLVRFSIASISRTSWALTFCLG